MLPFRGVVSAWRAAVSRQASRAYGSRLELYTGRTAWPSVSCARTRRTVAAVRCSPLPISGAAPVWRNSGASGSYLLVGLLGRAAHVHDGEVDVERARERHGQGDLHLAVQVRLLAVVHDGRPHLAHQRRALWTAVQQLALPRRTLTGGAPTPLARPSECSGSGWVPARTLSGVPSGRSSTCTRTTGSQSPLTLDQRPSVGGSDGPQRQRGCGHTERASAELAAVPAEVQHGRIHVEEVAKLHVRLRHRHLFR